MSKHQTDWIKCVNVCNNGVATIVGKIKGTITRLKMWHRNITVVIVFCIAILLCGKKYQRI